MSGFGNDVPDNDDLEIIGFLLVGPILLGMGPFGWVLLAFELTSYTSVRSKRCEPPSQASRQIAISQEEARKREMAAAQAAQREIERAERQRRLQRLQRES